MAGVGAVKIDARRCRPAAAPMRRACLAATCLIALGPGRLGGQELVTVRFSVPAWAAVDSVRRLGIDVVEIRPTDGGTVELAAVAGAGDLSLLFSRGYLPEVVPRAPLVAAQEARRAELGARAYTVFRDFDDPIRGVAAFLRSLAATRANVFVDSVGASYEGRPILAVKVGSPDDSPTRANVLFMATYHAREWIATEMALRLALFLAESLPSRPGGAALLAGRDVWVLPVVNPDGYQYTFTTTRLWRKNRRPNGDGSFGVDLNRNHAAQFALDDVGSSPFPAAATYRGARPESEPETQAVVAFHRRHQPVISVSYHSYIGAILYPWGHAAGAFTGDQPIFEALAGTAAAPAVLDSVPGSSLTQYHPGPGWQLYTTNGGYDNWAYQTLGTIAFTPELTAGCCVGGQPYGFEFPDDEGLIARVFRDNLPFALAALAAAEDPAHAVGSSGLVVARARFEAVWPRVRATGPVESRGVVEMAADPGVVRTLGSAGDSLGAGRSFSRVESVDPAIEVARALRVAPYGIVAELVAREGAERPESRWSGFRVESCAVEGSRCWYGVRDTLTSPAVDVVGRRDLRLFFWTRHHGSLFERDRRGRVEMSTDGGATWTLVAQLAGSGPEWYPVSVPLDGAAGAASLVLRFVAEGLEWSVDAVALAAGGSTLFGAAAGGAAEQLGLSANPVRGPTVSVRWTPRGGAARVEVYSFAGTLVAAQTLPSDPGAWTWNLTTVGGAALASGVYIVVVTRGDGSRLRRRLFVARSSGG